MSGTAAVDQGRLALNRNRQKGRKKALEQDNRGHGRQILRNHWPPARQRGADASRTRHKWDLERARLRIHLRSSIWWQECQSEGPLENADNAAKKWIDWCISAAMLSRGDGCHNFSRIAASSGNPAMTVFN